MRVRHDVCVVIHEANPSASASFFGHVGEFIDSDGTQESLNDVMVLPNFGEGA